MQWERNNFSEQFGMTLKMEEMKADLFLKTVLKNIDLPPPPLSNTNFHSLKVHVIEIL